jgi:hypothetical protein
MVSTQSPHGETCPCRHCASGSHVDLLLRADYQRQEMSRLSDEIKRLRLELSRERRLRHDAEIQAAIAKGDAKAYVAAMAAREAA